MDDYSRLEHLKMIQAIVSRLGGHSFLIKGWTVTLATGIIAIAVGAKQPQYSVLALYPALVFWGLDAFYVRQERLFRELHSAVSSAGAGEFSTFRLDTVAVRPKVDSWFATLFAPTVVSIHAAAVFIAAAIPLVAISR